MSILDYGFMQRALVAAVLIGLTAPSVGIYLVQRRLALIGDGLGHVALAGVAVGILTDTSPVWTALAVAVAGAVVVELVRSQGRASGEIALAILFYGGIAAGVVIISQAPGGTPTNLNSYLFGAITTTTRSDVEIFAVLALAVLVVTTVLRRYLFAISNDEEYAVAAGLPVLRLNLVLAVLTAVTVVVSMRVVGLLLVSALMIVPVATAQVVARSFRGTLVIATALAVSVSVGGVVTSFHTSTPAGGMIILLAIAGFLLATISRTALRSRRGSGPGGRGDGSRRRTPGDGPRRPAPRRDRPRAQPAP